MPISILPNIAAGRKQAAKAVFAGLFSLLFACGQSLYAQIQFVPGYYITEQGDTIRGKIDQQAGSRTPKQIQFLEDGKPTSFSAQTARGFGIKDGAHFNRFYVTYSTRPVDINLLRTGDFEDKMVSDTVFLAKMIAGKWSLYSLYAERFIYFIQEDNEAPQELTYKVYLTDNQQYYDEKKIFRNQLNNMLLARQIDPAVLKRLETLNYTATELSLFVKRLNKSVGISTVTAGGGPPRKFLHVYGGLGYSFNSFSVEKSGSKELRPYEYMSYTTSNSPMAQVGIELSNQEMLGPIMIRVEVGYHALKIKGQGMYNEFNYYRDLYLSLDIDARLIQPSVQALCKVVRGKNLDAFAGAGFGANFFHYKTSQLTMEYEAYEGHPPTATVHSADLRKKGVLVHLLAGITVKNHYQFQAQYSLFGTAIPGRINKTNDLRMVQLQVNYRF